MEPASMAILNAATDRQHALHDCIDPIVAGALDEEDASSPWQVAKPAA